MSLLTVANVSHAFGGLKALQQVSFTVEKGSITAVIGPNGAGKTTLFNVISGTLKSQSGAISYGNKPIHGLPPYKIAQAGISRTFQNIKLFGHLTALENVMVGRHVQSASGFAAGMLCLPATWQEEKDIKKSSLEILEFLGIADLAQQEAGSLAFGKQRMVEFARALATAPDLLLLDEPAAGLNIHETAEMGAFITRVRDERGITVLVVEHDMSLVMDISDQIVVLNYGQKIAEGRPAAIQKDTEVIRIYLGEDYA